MSGLILYSYRRCPFAMRVRMVLEEKGIVYTRIEEKLSDLSPELLALHPQGRVPLLVHDIDGKKQVIYQSSVITEYLDEEFGGTPLMPKTPRARAQVRLWTYWCDEIFKPELDRMKYEQSKLSGEDLEVLKNNLHAHLSHWNSALEATGYLVGKKMSLADIHLFPFARQFLGIKPPLPDVEKYQALHTWLNAMTSRPAFDRCMAK